MSEFQSFSSNVQSPNSHYAGFWWRFLASFIDNLIVQGAGLLMGLGLGLVFGLALLSTGMDEAATMLLKAILNLVSLAVGIVLGWLYYALLESSAWQATVGKKICKLQVTDLEGNRLSFARASGRYFGKIVSAIPLFIGYVMAAFTEKKQALHDLIAGTVVVKSEQA